MVEAGGYDQGGLRPGMRQSHVYRRARLTANVTANRLPMFGRATIASDEPDGSGPYGGSSQPSRPIARPKECHAQWMGAMLGIHYQFRLGAP
jgi:hypothetical protein